MVNRRWYYVVMVAVAIAISYFDRQTLPVAIAAIQRNIPLSNPQFAYPDRIPARLGNHVCIRRAPA